MGVWGQPVEGDNYSHWEGGGGGTLPPIGGEDCLCVDLTPSKLEGSKVPIDPLGAIWSDLVDCQGGCVRFI